MFWGGYCLFGVTRQFQWLKYNDKRTCETIKKINNDDVTHNSNETILITYMVGSKI